MPQGPRITEDVRKVIAEVWLEHQDWVGKVIDTTIIDDLKKLNIDICGENGEYHTMTLNAPFYSKELNIDSYTIIEHEHYFYLNKQLTTS